MAQNRTWTLTEAGQSRSWTLTQSSESKTFSVTPSTATRNFTVSPGVGPTGPNEVTTSTSTDITGIFKGDGSTVSAAVADTDYQSVPAEGAFADGDKTKLDGVETGADVTDATNVNAAGAVMESDFTPAFSMIVQQSGTGAPEMLQVGTNTIVGRVTGGGSEIDDLSPTQVRSLINVEDGATADQSAAEILTAIKTVDGTGSGLDADLLDGQEATAFAAASHTHTTSDITDTTTDGITNTGQALVTDAETATRFPSVTVQGVAEFGDDDTSTQGQIRLFGVGGAVNSGIAAANLTASRSHQMPDGSGSLAITSQADGSIHADDLDFAGSTDIGADLADADEVMVSDGGGNTTRRKSALSRFWAYIKAKIESVTLSTLDISGDLTVDTTTLHVDSTNNNVGIGTITPSDTLHVIGDAFLDHTATENDEHALEIDCDAAGFSDVKAVDIVYTTGAMAADQVDSAVLINFDETLATGGDLVGLEVLTTEGSADKVIGLFAGGGVDPVEQLTGTLADAAEVLVLAVDQTVALSGGGAGNITTFSNDNDTVTVGSAAKFSEIEALVDTAASGAGIGPTFEFSTGSGTWASFSPTDGTNGIKNSGIIAWIQSDLATWAVGTSGNYLVRITRTRNSLSTVPILDKVQVLDATEYYWDKDGAISAASGTLTGDLTVDTDTLHVDSSNDRVGIGTTGPNVEFDVRGQSHVYHNGVDSFKVSSTTGVGYAMGRNTGTGLFDIKGDQVGFTGYRFEDADGSKHMEIETGGDVSIGSGSLTFDANSATWDGATITADQTMSGQLELTGQTLSGDNSAVSRVLMQRNTLSIWSLPLTEYHYASATNTGSGTGFVTENKLRVNTGTTTGSTAMRRISSFEGSRFAHPGGNSAGASAGIDFDSSWSLSMKAVAVDATNAGSVYTDCELWIVFGVLRTYTGTAQPTTKSCGFTMRDGLWYAFKHNGSTYTESSSNILDSTGENPDIVRYMQIVCDGTNIYYYIDGTLVDTLATPGGFTAQDYNSLNFSANNKTSTEDIYLEVLFPIHWTPID